MEYNMNVDKKGMTPEAEGSEAYNKTTKTGNALKKGRFNFVDAFLLLIIFAAVISLVAYFLPGIRSYFSNEEKYNVVYKIEFRGVDGDIITDGIKSGMPVYDSQNNYEIGKIKGAIEIVPHVTFTDSVVKNENGEYEVVTAEHPKLKNVIITVEGTAIYSADDEGFLVNGQRIAVGREFRVRLGGFNGVGYCVSFTREAVVDAASE